MLKPKPFYGVDGNLLVADLPYEMKAVQAVLNGTFKPAFWAQNFLPGALMLRYPHLLDEKAKRAHRKASRAYLEQKRRQR